MGVVIANLLSWLLLCPTVFKSLIPSRYAVQGGQALIYIFVIAALGIYYTEIRYYTFFQPYKLYH